MLTGSIFLHRRESPNPELKLYLPTLIPREGGQETKVSLPRDFAAAGSTETVMAGCHPAL